VRSCTDAELHPTEAIACAMPLGMGVISLIVLVLGLLGWLTQAAVWLMLSVLTVSLLRKWYRTIWMFVRKRPGLPALMDQPNEFIVVCSLALAFAIPNLMWTLAPEVEFDALNYHLAVPKAFLQHSRIIELPFLQYYLARLVELFLTVCLVVEASATAKLWVFLMSVCAVLSVFALGRRFFDARIGVWAAALFATTPLVGWLSGTVYIDNIIAMTIAASFIAFIHWDESGKAGWLILTGAIAGVAVGSKLNASKTRSSTQRIMASAQASPHYFAFRFV